MLLSEKESKAICEKVLALSTAEDARVRVTSNENAHLRFAANHFTTTGRTEDASAEVTVWIGKHIGSATAANVDDESLVAAVRQAEALARIAPVDQEYVATVRAQQYKPTHGYEPRTANFSAEARAQQLAEIIHTCEKEKLIGAGFHQVVASARAFATKNGAFQYEESTRASLSVTARTPDGKASGYFLRNHFDIAKLDTKRIGREAIDKALHSRDPHVIEPGTYPVILEEQAAADLVWFFLDARTADEGRSPFSAAGGKTRVGERVCDERLNIYSDPWHPELPGSSAAQDGIPAEKIYFVRNGVLERLSYTRYWAKEKKTEPTPGPVNTIVESSGPTATVAEMIAAMDRGFLISRFFYIRVVEPRTALVTGLTRDGVWYIEKGKIQHAVRNFRFNQSILELLAPGNVQMIGRSERVSSSESAGEDAQLMPALMVKKFNFTSLSDAV
jgi:predicted Zn-dependent protease